MKKFILIASVLTILCPTPAQAWGNYPKFTPPQTQSGYPETTIENVNQNQIKQWLIGYLSDKGYMLIQEGENSLIFETSPKVNYGLMTSSYLFQSRYQQQSTSFQCKNRLHITLISTSSAEGQPAYRVLLHEFGVQNVGSPFEAAYDNSKRKGNQEELYSLLGALKFNMNLDRDTRTESIPPVTSSAPSPTFIYAK
jgi:hypothetical protein